MELNGRSSSWVISVIGQRSIRSNYIPNNNRIKLNLQCVWMCVGCSVVAIGLLYFCQIFSLSIELQSRTLCTTTGGVETHNRTMYYSTNVFLCVRRLIHDHILSQLDCSYWKFGFDKFIVSVMPYRCPVTFYRWQIAHVYV